MAKAHTEQRLASLTERIVYFLETQGGKFTAPEGNGVKRLAELIGTNRTQVSAATKRLIARGLLEKDARPGKVYAYRLLSPDPQRKAPARPLLRHTRQRGTPAPAPWNEIPVFPVTVRELTKEDEERLGLSRRPLEHSR